MQKNMSMRSLPSLALLGLAVSFTPAGAGEKAAAHAVVPGFERFHAAKPDAAGGRLLLTELGCVNCHQSAATSTADLAARKGPNLDLVGSRLKPEGIRKFLADPHAAKPGTVMPDLLGHLQGKERVRTVEELVHFLASTGSVRPERVDRKAVIQGRDLYGKVGCVACHGSRKPNGEPDKATSTTVPLGDLESKYTILSLAAFLADPLHARPSGRMPRLLDGKEARNVAHYLLQGTSVAALPGHIPYKFYEGSWNELPDFTKLKPRDTGMAPDFDVSVALRGDNFGLRFEGWFKADRAGEYRFFLTSDDGSRLRIGDKVVVSNDGIHPATTKSGAIELTKGMHPIVVEYFEQGGEEVLVVEVEWRGKFRQRASTLVYPNQEGTLPPAKVAGKKGEEPPFRLDPDLAAKGKAAFTSLGCIACHQMKPAGKVAPPSAPALVKLTGQGGCLGGKPGAKTPHYALSAAQKTALAAALTGGKAPTEDAIARTMQSLNCYACHVRDKIGGPEEAWNTHFKTTQPEMGDEGRLPPVLTGVGGKLTDTWLKTVLANGANDRPYMHTRMPAFGDAGQHLVAAFVKADPVIPVKFEKPNYPESQLKSAGRHMTGGLVLGCVKCHTFAGQKAEGVQGIDMTLFAQHLRPEWFHRYLADPQKIRSGTRMPASWPGGVSLLPKVLDGQADSQIHAIWVYLSDGKKARPPIGLGPKFIPLIPETEAILYRNFIAGGGSRAIGVGYPEQVNLCFDANDLGLAMAWKGLFIDASKHWTDRGVGYQGPLGDDILKLPGGPNLAVLEKPDAPWPVSGRQEGFKFRGYRLTKDQRPTFLYQVGGIDVADFPNPEPKKAGAVLKRTVELQAKGDVANLFLRAAVGSQIEPQGANAWRINGTWTLRLLEAGKTTPLVRTVGGNRELLIPAFFPGGTFRIVYEIAW